MVHLTDMAVNRQQDIYPNEGGDWALVSGLDNTKQSAALQVLDEADDLVGEQLTSNQLTKLRGRIRTEVEGDSEIEAVHEVRIKSIDKQKNEVNVHVSATPNDVPLTIPIPNQ